MAESLGASFNQPPRQGEELLGPETSVEERLGFLGEVITDRLRGVENVNYRDPDTDQFYKARWSSLGVSGITGGVSERTTSDGDVQWQQIGCSTLGFNGDFTLYPDGTLDCQGTITRNGVETPVQSSRVNPDELPPDSDPAQLLGLVCQRLADTTGGDSPVVLSAT